jgi:hypothetical protein
MKTILRKAIILAAIVVLPATFANEAKGGGSALIGPRAIVPGVAKTPVMVCKSCTTAPATWVAEGSKGRPGVAIQTSKHLCTGCKTVLTVEGHGKAKRDVVKHTCTVDVSAWCAKI